MKKTMFLITALCCLFTNAQTVSTFLSDNNIVVDDAMTFDTEGNLYGSNFAGNSVYKITPSGNASVFISGLANPNGLAFDSHGNLFVVEYSASKIHKYAPDGTRIQSFDVPDGVASNLIKSYNSDAMIYTNVVDQSINELATDGTITKLYVGAPLDIPVGLAYDNNGKLYIGNYLNREIYQLKNNGTVKYIATIPDSGTIFPYLAFITYANNLLWATNYGEQKIYTVKPNKLNDVVVFSGSTIGTTDGDISEATFTYPAGMAYKPSEDALYVNQYFNGNVRKISNISSYERPKVSFKIFPNPARHVTHVLGKISSPGAYTVFIYDMSGNLVYEAHENSGNNSNILTKVKISDFNLNTTDATGQYIVVLSTETTSESKILVVNDQKH